MEEINGLKKAVDNTYELELTEGRLEAIKSFKYQKRMEKNVKKLIRLNARLEETNFFKTLREALNLCTEHLKLGQENS